MNNPASIESASRERPWLRCYAQDIPSVLSDKLTLPLEAFDRALGRSPEQIAVHYFRSSLSYRDIDEQATRLVLHWQGAVRKGDRVAIVNQNTPSTLIGIVAAWRLGAVVMPLSPMLTQFELGHYLHNGEPKAALVGSLQAGTFQAAATNWGKPLSVVYSKPSDFLAEGDRPGLLQGLSSGTTVPSEWSPLTALSRDTSVPSSRIDPADIAFLTYTSGTTGKPKAAMNTHRNVAFSAAVYSTWLRLGPNDVLFAAAPFSHITGLVAHIATAWTAQVPLVLCYRFDADTVLELLELHRVTSMVATITAYVALLEHPKFNPERLTAFTKLFSGGAPVAKQIVERWERATGVYIHNAYGMTETTSPTHLVPFGARAPIDEGSGALSVGVPVPETDCEIVDMMSGNPYTSTVVGELRVRGPQVCRGYWCNDSETQATFTDQWLRTGDLARADADGWFYIVDRAKDVIVASGFKVWPREVEQVLEAHLAIREAAVIGVPDGYRGESPKAFVVLRSGQTATSEELKDFCRVRLSPYKVPRAIEFVSSLPRNVAGKLLRRELRGS